MNDSYQKPGIRVVREKEVADILADVVNNKDDLSGMEAGLHRVKAKQSKQQYIERGVFDEILTSQLLLARTVRRLAAEVKELREAATAAV